MAYNNRAPSPEKFLPPPEKLLPPPPDEAASLVLNGIGDAGNTIGGMIRAPLDFLQRGFSRLGGFVR